eukprot:12425076-Karenia_brevis.AAC.1
MAASSGLYALTGSRFHVRALCERLRDGIAIQIIGDSAVLINALLGRAVVSERSLLQPVRTAQEGLLRLT